LAARFAMERRAPLAEGFFEAFDVAFLLGPNPERGMFCLSPVERRYRRRPAARENDNARARTRIAA